MPYKDKDRQRQAVKLATQRYRLKLKGITSITEVSDNVIPSKHAKPQSYNPMMIGYVPPTD